MSKTLAVLCAVSAWAVSVQAQNVVPVGSGSYASFPPAQAGGTAVGTANQTLYVATNGVPVPSNKWWTSDVINQFAGNMWAYPLTVSANAQGVVIYDPVNWAASGQHPQLATDSPITIVGQGFSAADSRALRWGDWTLTMHLAQATNKFMDVTLGHGLPYVWAEFTGVQPQIQFAGGVTYFGDTGNSLSLPLTTNHFGVTYSGRCYGVFAPDNTQFTSSNGAVSVTFATTNAYLVIGVMPSQTNLSYFSQYAYAVPRDSQMNWTYDPNAGAVTTSWHLATQVLKGSQPGTIQGWLAHHWRNTINNLAFNGVQYSTARGLMKCAAGTDFQIVYNFNGILPIWPAPVELGLANDYDPARMAWYLTGVAASTNVAPDTYWGGKDMLRYAQHMAFANQMGAPQFTTLENTLRSILTNWFTYVANESTYYFAYYPGWKALVGFEASYGSDQFNDQHFHYGYFAHAAALLGMYDQSFRTNYGPMATLMAKEYANWDRNETNFPFMRTFDIWSGHSQASGFPDMTRGGNQESSSEAVQSWGGLFLLGSVLGDTQMQAAGAMGYTMESTAVREYWFNANGNSVWPPSYTASIVGILWDNGQEYQTYFGLVPIYMHGIQWLPPSPIMNYLVRDPAFARQDYNNMLSEQLAQTGDNSISSLGSQWGNYALSYAAQFNPDYSAAQEDQLWAANDFVATDVTYAGVTYYQTHSLRNLGLPQGQFHISVPTSAVYYNTNTAQYSFIAYNPQPTSQVAVIYSNNVVVGTMTLPPLTLVNQQTVGNVTIVTNVVAADVEPGVAVSWPTIIGTNYLLQCTTNLTANTVWTNLVGQVQGDGTTNSVFDPFGQFQKKFYQVLQLVATNSVSQNALLLNPGFETAGAAASNAANWSVTQAAGGPVYGIRTNDDPRSGSFNFEIHLASTGAGPVVRFQQAGVPVTSGAPLTFSFYANALPGASGDVLQWLVSWSGTNTVSPADTGFQNFTPGNGAYAQTSVQLTAPQNATAATVVFYCAGAANSNLSATIQFDDVSLTSTNSGGGGGGSGVNTNQVQAGIGRGVSISWFASNNVPYQVQWASDTSGNAVWSNWGSIITGNGTSNTVIDLTGPPHNAYQVLSIERMQSPGL